MSSLKKFVFNRYTSKSLGKISAAIEAVRLVFKPLPVLREKYWFIGADFRSQTIVFDVGANSGDSFIPLAKRCSNVRVVAFEPTPELVENIRRKTRTFPNYEVVAAAVSDLPGVADFHVAANDDWGTSSLNTYSSDVIETWKGRTDLKVTRTIRVPVIRLDDFCAQRGINVIDWLHVDAQGSDLNVLRSLGGRLINVRGGVVEVPKSKDVKLYNGQHTRDEMEHFLSAQNFEVFHVTQQHNEENLYFRSKNLT